jgi:hypothetical protein
MVGPRRPTATSAETGHSAADVPPRSGNGDAPEVGLVRPEATPDGASHQLANDPPPNVPDQSNQEQPAQPASRIKVLGCKIENPHLLPPHKLARIVVPYLALRIPAVFLLLALTYKYNLKTVAAHAEKLQLNYGELITVAVCVALFIVLAVILIPRRRRGGPEDENPR